MTKFLGWTSGSEFGNSVCFDEALGDTRDWKSWEIKVKGGARSKKKKKKKEKNYHELQ